MGRASWGRKQEKANTLIELWAKFGQTWKQEKGRTNQNQDAKRRRESLKIVFRFLPGRSPGHPESGPAPSLSTLEQRKTTCDPTGAQKITKKSRKSPESRPKEAVLRPKWDPKIDQKRTRDRKSAFGDGVGSDFFRCRAPLPFTVDLETNFWKV